MNALHLALTVQSMITQRMLQLQPTTVDVVYIAVLSLYHADDMPKFF